MSALLDFDLLLQSRGWDSPLILESFIRAAYSPINRLATVVLQDSSQVESATQTILLNAYKRLDTYEPGANFPIWLYRIAFQTLRTHQQKDKFRELFQKQGGIKPDESGKGKPAKASENYPLALVLYGFDLEVSEIAVILNSREHTIQTQIENALKALRSPGGELEQTIHTLQADLVRMYPLSAAPPDGFPALMERMQQCLDTGRKHSPSPFGPWRELAWIALVLAFLAGTFWTFNRSEPQNTSLPIFPSPTPPLPDVIAPKTLLISEQPAYEDDALQYVGEPTLSANGRYIVYSASENEGTFVFLHDRENGETHPIQVIPPGGFGIERSDSPDISDDGRQVVFTSISTNFSEEDLFASCGSPNIICSQVLLYDQENGEIELISASEGGESGNQSSMYPAISGDGRRVAFWSYANNLVPGDVEPCEGPDFGRNCADIFVKDLEAGTIQRIRVGRNEMPHLQSARLDLSFDGQWLVFTIESLDKVRQSVRLGTNPQEVVAIHLPTGEYHPVNLAPDASMGNGASHFGSISGNGRNVAFVSSASNLVPGDTNREKDVFVHDLETSETVRVSVGANGEQADGPSGVSGVPNFLDRLSISNDGRWVVFLSYALNMLTNFNAIWCPNEWSSSIPCHSLFVYDRESGRTSQLDLRPTSELPQSETHIVYPSISSDGRGIAFLANIWFISEACPDGNCSNVYVFDTAQEEISPVTGPPLEKPGENAWRFQGYLQGHENWVNAVAISPGGLLASAGQEGKLLLWSIAEEQLLGTLLEAAVPLSAVTFSPDNAYLAAGDQSGNVCVFTLPTGETFQCMSEHPGQVRSLAFSQDSQLLLAASRGSVRVWRLLDEEFIHVREYPYPGGLIESIAISPDGELFAAAVGSEVWLRKISDGAVIARLDANNPNILDMNASIADLSMTSDNAKVYDLAFSPNGLYLASGADDQTAVLWKIQKMDDGWDFEYQRTLIHHEWVRALAFSSDSKTLATGSFDSTITLWNIPEGEHLKTLRRTTQDQVLDLTFSPENTYIAAGTVLGLRLWKFGLPDHTTTAEYQFYTLDKDETLTTNDVYMSPAPQGFTGEPIFTTSVAEAQSLVSFPIQEPSLTLPDFNLYSVVVFKDTASGFESVSLSYLQTTNFQPSVLTITQSRTNPKLFDWPLGKFARVTSTIIHGFDAELVLGGWNTTGNTFTSPNGQLIFEHFWDPELASRWLRWQEESLYFALLFDQPFNEQSISANELFPLEQFIAFADSIE